MKKIFKSLLIVFLVANLAIANTSSYFSDIEISTGNIFSTGTLDLKLNEEDNITATWAENNLKPEMEVTGLIDLKNTGTISADHLHLRIVNTIIDAVSGPGTVTTPSLDSVLEITSLTYDGINILTSVSDVNGNGIKDLDDLEHVSNFGHTLPVLNLTDLNVNHPFEITVKLNKDKANVSNQGDSISTDFIFNLYQNASQ